jgi:hypothetical protein
MKEKSSTVQRFKRSTPDRHFRANQWVTTGGLLELSDLLQDLFVRWPDRVICFGKLPTYYSLGINHIRRWMRPALAVRVEKPIAIDHFVIGILKQGKSRAAIVCRLKFLTQLFRILMAVDAYRQDLRFPAVLFV